MASTPPGDGSILPDGWTWSDIGHGVLDVVGVVPLVGEGADLVNAAWYAAEGNYLDAGLSVISMVPVVGDIIGKGGKIVKKAGGKLAGPALDALRKMDFKKTLEPLRKHPKIGPHVDKMVEALEKWRKDLIGEAPPCTPGGTQKCPLENPPTVVGKFEPKGYKGSPLKSEVGRDMVASLERSGLKRDDAIATAQQLLESGMSLPKAVPVNAGDKLFKFSPNGASDFSPYWMTESQYNQIKNLPPDKIMSVLGLPPSSYPGAGKEFVVEFIEAKSSATVFQSTIAPVQQGAYVGLGGAQQTLVTERGLFGPPQKVKR